MLIGIVGKPNVGKSTFFKASTLAEVAIASYPFTTIKANEGVGFIKVKCPEIEKKLKCKPNHGFCISGWRFIPIKLLDVAGLVPGAHAGKGLGNKFLDDLRQADALIHVIDVSGTTNEEGKLTKDYDPSKDIKFLQEEIDKWFYGIIGEDWKLLVRKIQVTDVKPLEELARKFSGLKITEEMIKEAIKNCALKEEFVSWNDEQLFSFVQELRKLSKPMIIAANKCDMPQAKENLKKLQEEFPEMIIVSCSAESELALREAARDSKIDYVPGSNEFAMHDDKLSEKQKKGLEFVKDKILEIYNSTGVQRCLNKAIFSLLKYIVVYPVENENHFTDGKNNVLPDAFLLPPNSSALDLAYVIHTDIGNAFIAAIDARTHKRLARDYELKEGDIIRIMTK
ncbi:MAG: redox-regulated ATPase YchF [Candidatus Pacearchaeota archaeon]|nr:MAG: redox-regulated ATPase YchF [Candidatus Pacearchaeota archaeon]